MTKTKKTTATVEDVTNILENVLRKHFCTTAMKTDKIKKHVNPKQSYAGIKETTLFRGYSLMRLDKFSNVKKTWPKTDTWLEMTSLELAEDITQNEEE